MSSAFILRQNRYFIAAAASQFVVAASIIMIVYVLADGWLW
jgi:hypothetical protein